MKKMKNSWLPPAGRTTLLVVALIMSVACQEWLSDSQELLERGEEIKEITFYGNYLSEMATKASEPFSSGNKAWIYGYKGGETPANEELVTPNQFSATAGSGGKLTSNVALYLPKGSYNFYSFSQNSSTLPQVTFTGGVSGSLTNGVDYLWAKAENIAQGGSATFNYSHSAVKLELVVVKDTGVDKVTVTEIKVTLPKVESSNKINLATGEIVPATAVAAATALSTSNNSATTIMLPLSSNSLTVSVKAQVDIGELKGETREYSATIPKASYLAGTHHKVTLKIGANTITFGNATVSNWTVTPEKEIQLEES